MATQPGSDAGHKKNVLLVDDHPTFRRGLRNIIEGQADLAVCGEAGTAQEALRAIRELQPDIAIVDISLKESSGLELMKDIKTRYAELPVLALSMHDEVIYAERALRAGAKGYVMKDESPEEVLAAIRKILSGALSVSERMSARLLHQAIGGRFGEGGYSVERLGDRELEVLGLIGRGLGTRQIAKQLHRSVKTIDSHRAHIKEKLGLKNASELTLYAVRWVEDETMS